MGYKRAAKGFKVVKNENNLYEIFDLVGRSYGDYFVKTDAIKKTYVWAGMMCDTNINFADRFDWEKNDCVIRAYSIFLNKPYSEIHARFKRMGRQDREGTPVSYIYYYADEVGAVLLERNIREFLYVGQLVEFHPTGKFLVNVLRHTFVLEDGIFQDSDKVRYYEQIRSVFYFEDKK